LEHIVAVQIPGQIAADKTVFKTITVESCHWHTVSQQTPDLIYHPAVQTALQALCYASADDLTFDLYPENKRPERRQLNDLRVPASLLMKRNFNGPDKPLPLQQIGRVVLFRKQCQKPSPQLAKGKLFQLPAQLRVLRCSHHPVAAQHRVQIETGTAGQNRKPASCSHQVESFGEVTLEIKDAELPAGFEDIDQVMRDPVVLFEILAAPYIHPPENLARIGRNDLAVQSAGSGNSQTGLSRSGRTENDKEIGAGSTTTVIRMIQFVLSIGLLITLRLWQECRGKSRSGDPKKSCCTLLLTLVIPL